MLDNKNKIEVLAPAGSYDIMTAVINAGADAVYLGGNMFGARAYAGNFDQEQLLRAIDFAHLHDKKIYMTVNTLLKEQEILNHLVEYIIPYYEAGLDAVIVQDMGVLKVIHEHFPDLPIHASTQMNVTGSNGARLLSQMGATRIVTARELSLSEIETIHNSCNIEIESFVHGALCYCYSGECLLSSMNGGRSGNRGRCAQPCRLAYDVIDKNNKPIFNKEGSYLLSPKDMCALSILPDVIEAGIYSLKIEGRMKNVTYAAGVTAMYRKYVDLYLEKGRAGYRVLENDLHDLMDIYNRGAFTDGYFKNKKGKEMISISRPNHRGTEALKITGNKNGLVTFKVLEPVNPQDVFEVDAEHSFTSGSAYAIGDIFQMNLPKKLSLPVGRTIFRTKSNALAETIRKCYVEAKIKKSVTATVTAQLGQPLSLRLSDGIHESYVKGPCVTAAVSQPITKEKIARQIAKLGDTDFLADCVKIELDQAVFIPVGQLNEIRREAVIQLTDTITRSYRRTYFSDNNAIASTDSMATAHLGLSDLSDRNHISVTIPSVSILLTDLKQVRQALRISEISSIYYDFSMFVEPYDTVSDIVSECHAVKKKAIMALPHVLREQNNTKIKKMLIACSNAGFDALLVRNIEEFGFISKLLKDTSDFCIREIITDAALYAWNSQALKELRQIAKQNDLTLAGITLPYEQTHTELERIAKSEDEPRRELVVYTRLPLMLSEQCVKKTLEACDSGNGSILIKNKKNQQFSVKSVCSYCYSIIYDSEIMDITDMKNEIAKVRPDSVRYEFIDGNEDIRTFFDQTIENAKNINLSRGHFLLGVE